MKYFLFIIVLSTILICISIYSKLDFKEYTFEESNFSIEVPSGFILNYSKGPLKDQTTIYEFSAPLEMNTSIKLLVGYYKVPNLRFFNILSRVKKLQDFVKKNTPKSKLINEMDSTAGDDYPCRYFMVVGNTPYSQITLEYYCILLNDDCYTLIIEGPYWAKLRYIWSYRFIKSFKYLIRTLPEKNLNPTSQD